MSASDLGVFRVVFGQLEQKSSSSLASSFCYKNQKRPLKPIFFENWKTQNHARDAFVLSKIFILVGVFGLYNKAIIL